MPPPFSTDLRWRIVWQVIVLHTSPDEVAEQFCVSTRSVNRFVAQFEQSGDVTPKVGHNGPQRLLGEEEQLLLLRLILENPGIYLRELQYKLLSITGVNVSAPTVCRTLRYMGCSRQKIQYIALQRSDACRARFMAEISMYDPVMLVWVDETGCDKRNCRRRYGYSVRGIPPQDHRILVRGVRYSGIPVMSLQGIHDVQIVEGSVNGIKFEEFILQTLMPILNPFNGTNPLSVVIMDNCSIHHTSPVKHLIENVAHAKLLFLPPYSPDLMPLEEVFSKVKYTIKDNDRLFQTCTAPRPMLALAFSMVTPENCAQYVHHSGYI